MSDELKKIYSKYFDDSGEMKPKGKAIMGEGLKGLSGPKTITEKGAFLPKAKDVVTKAAKASKYGKIAAGVAGAGLALKQYLKSKTSTEEVDKKSMGGKIYKADAGKYFDFLDMGKDSTTKEEKEEARKTAKSLVKELKGDAKGSAGPFLRKSMGGETTLSPKQMKIARMAPPPNKITGADFKAMKASSGKMIMARGCEMGKNKPTKLS